MSRLTEEEQSAVFYLVFCEGYSIDLAEDTVEWALPSEVKKWALKAKESINAFFIVLEKLIETKNDISNDIRST